MAIPKKVINFLEKGKVKYEAIGHRTVDTAFDKAKTLKRGPLAGGWRVGRSPEKMVGKTLILKMDGKLTVVLIPANKNLDLQKFKKLAKALPAACLPDRQGRQVKKIDFASERLIKNKFKARLPRYAKHCGQGVKVGVIPPFGNLWGLRTFIDNFLMREKEIILNSGDYNFSIKISSNQLKKILPDAIFGNFSEKKK